MVLGAYQGGDYLCRVAGLVMPSETEEVGQAVEMHQENDNEQTREEDDNICAGLAASILWIRVHGDDTCLTANTSSTGNTQNSQL